MGTCITVATFLFINLDAKHCHFIEEGIDCTKRAEVFAEWSEYKNRSYYKQNGNDCLP
jgi:hypothetical protein